ncbi:MAG: tRNA lysidine(34) synthetase TilS [Kiritimatiellae bacterium]|nr:tRNA lysidine(34) synthetase TilS [Kiritimatiellia bacterium]MDD4342453.1 tRNA lysidine(34) synthetase TilS [Kiritimatiellia bacterium]
MAASGGADSTALVLALKELGVEIVLAHVHHGIRGKSADGDARFVRAWARRLGVPFHLGRVDVPAEAQSSGESLEMAARRLRRGFLVATAHQEKIQQIAVGHTADDQAETILMRIVRGTGVAGLAGIPYETVHGGVSFIRPLRDVTREEVLAWLNRRRQRWRDDETNADDFAMRNRVRNEILPLLERRLNPAVRQALLRLGDIAAAEDEVMSALADQAQRSEHPGQAPLAIRRRLALAELHCQGVSPGAIDFAAIESLSRGGDGIPTPAPGFPQCGKKFSIAWKNRQKVFHSVENPSIAPTVHIREGRGFSRHQDEVCLSAAAVAGRDLVLRSWRAGDRMEPLGMTGSKKLSDIFTDLKVPRAERQAWMVVDCDGQIAALAGWRVARDFAVEGPHAPSIRIRWTAKDA